MRVIKRALLVLLGLLLLLTAVVVVNTLRQSPHRLQAVPDAPLLAVDAEGAALSLAAAVRARTVNEGFVWGRGAWDDKGNLIAELEAVEALLASGAYRQIAAAVRDVFPNTVVAPALMLGATDGRHFAGVADHVYRFSPIRSGPPDLQRFHGTNERLSVANLAEMIRFYHRLVQQAAQ